MALSVHHRISIAQIPIYTVFLFGGIYLAIRHGFGRNAGWLYLILLSLIRLIGASLDLATISDPTNLDLYIGSATLQSIGLSALILLLLGLIGRVIASVTLGYPGRIPVIPKHLRLVQTLVVVGLILGIVGGVKAGTQVKDNGGLYQMTTPESKAGLAFMIVGFAAIAAVTALMGRFSRYAGPGEGRLVVAVAASLPFVLVRLVYSCMGTYSNDSRFRGFFKDQYLWLGMSVLMEIIVVLICEATGLTLKIPNQPVLTEGWSHRAGKEDA